MKQCVQKLKNSPTAGQKFLRNINAQWCSTFAFASGQDFIYRRTIFYTCLKLSKISLSWYIDECMLIGNMNRKEMCLTELDD